MVCSCFFEWYGIVVMPNRVAYTGRGFFQTSLYIIPLPALSARMYPAYDFALPPKMRPLYRSRMVANSSPSI